MTKYYEVIDRESTNSDLANNGGDYTEGHDLMIENGKVVAGRFWTSAEFDYCPHRGTYDRCKEPWCSDEYEGPIDLTGGRWVDEMSGRFYKVQS